MGTSLGRPIVTLLAAVTLGGGCPSSSAAPTTDLRRGLHGMYRYLADAPRFEECLTGRSYPVAMEGDYLALERAYVELPKSAPGAPILANFEGDIVQRAPMEGPGTVPTVVVRRFVGLWPSQTCERAMSHASLANQYWRVARLHGTPAGPIEGSREPHLILRGAGGGYSASAGCERFNGAYRVDGPQIAFDLPPEAGTCPPALQAQQHSLVEALSAARQWWIQGQVLELFDAAGTPVAVLEAVYLR